MQRPCSRSQVKGSGGGISAVLQSSSGCKADRLGSKFNGELRAQGLQTLDVLLHA